MTNAPWKQGWSTLPGRADARRLRALIDDALLDWEDVGGRLLGEQASRAYVDRGDTVRCPYVDGRRGHPMNGAALAQVMGAWPEVLATLQAHGGPTAAHAWRACCRLRWGPLWGEPPVSEPVAAVFKTVLGLQRPLTAWLMLHPGAAARPLPDLVGGALAERLDQEGWLHGQVQVCAGPMGRIREAWLALHQPGPPEPDRAEVAAWWVAGLWVVLANARRCVREDRVPRDWAWTGAVDEHWPLSLQRLRCRGPGAWVREIEVFDPAWVLRLFEDQPSSLLRLLDACEDADPKGLDAAFDRFLEDLDAAQPS